MSTLQASLNLSGSTRPLEAAKDPIDRRLASKAEVSDDWDTLRGHAAALEIEDSAFLAVVQALPKNGNIVPPLGQELPLEAVDPTTSWRAAPVGGLGPEVEAVLATADQRLRGGDLKLAVLGGEFELSPIAQALERLQGPKPIGAPGESGSNPLVGRFADVASAPPLGPGVIAMTPSPEVSSLARPTFLLEVPLGQPKWADALGERVVMMLHGDQQVARLRLDPPHLGPMELRVALNQDQASVAFVAQHALVREALEQAIPRLRELLGQQDLQLVDVDVSQGELTGGRREGESAHGSMMVSTGGTEPTGGLDESAASQSEARLSPRLIDLFA